MKFFMYWFIWAPFILALGPVGSSPDSLEEEKKLVIYWSLPGDYLNALFFLLSVWKVAKHL